MDDRRLARGIRSDQPEDFPGRHRKGQIPDLEAGASGRGVRIGEADAVKPDEGRHGMTRPARERRR